MKCITSEAIRYIYICIYKAQIYNMKISTRTRYGRNEENKKKVKAQSISFFFFFFFFPNIISTIFHENNHVLFKYFFFRLNDKNNFAKIKNNDIHSTKHTSIWSKME